MEQADGTSTSGNTHTDVHKRRNYFVTFWTHDYPRALPSNATYMCTCEDSTKEGKWHGHAFIYFKNPVKPTAVKKLFGNDEHDEKPHKNSECIEYVLNTEKRKHDFQEFGERPMDNGLHRTVAELKNIKNPDELDWHQFNAWQKIKALPKKIQVGDWHKDIEVHYFYNPHSGKGKTLAIVNFMKEHNIEEFEEIKHIGDFWHGVVDGTGVAVYDDFRPSHMAASEFVNFIDYNVHSLNVKNGSIQNRYNIILISSIINPTKLYKNMNDEDRDQWLRRMQIHNIDPESILEGSISIEDPRSREDF